MQNEPLKHVDLIERCDCGSAHFCSVRYWRDEDWPSGYFEIEMADRCDWSLWARVHAAWEILRHGKCYRGDVVLDEAKAARLVEALTPIAQASS